MPFKKMLKDFSGHVSSLSCYLVIVAFVIILYCLSGYLRSLALCMKINGPKTSSVFGNVLLLMNKNLLQSHIGPAYNLYGSLVRVWVFFLPFFVILDPDDIQEVLSSKKHTEKIFIYRLLHNFLGNGLITSSGEKWNFHRKLIQPSFHRNLYEQLIGTFADASNNLLTKIKQSKPFAEINITHLVNNCILDVLNESILGVSIKNNPNKNNDDSPFRKGKMMMQFRLSRPWLLLDWIYSLTESATSESNQKQQLNNFTRKMILIRREKMKQTNGEKQCLLDHMLAMAEQNPTFTDEDIVDEACTFMLAGQDSVGAAVAFCLFLLTQNPECQNKCYREISEILDGEQNNNNTHNSQRLPTIQDLKQMRYLEQCIKETLRLYPSVPLIARKISEDIRIGKNTLSAGSNVIILPYATHRIEHIYPNPEQFDPDRFTSDLSSRRSPYAFLPFSAGPRNCIGYKFAIFEMQTIIATILRNYELIPVEGKTKINPVFRITVRASGGLWIRFKDRKLEV